MRRKEKGNELTMEIVVKQKIVRVINKLGYPVPLDLLRFYNIVIVLSTPLLILFITVNLSNLFYCDSELQC